MDSIPTTRSTLPPLIHLTGYGPFGGILHNPSSILVSHISASLEAYNVRDAEILEVSIRGVRGYLDTMAEFASSAGLGRNHLLVHLGVAAGQPNFHFETRASNRAHFRIPDVVGNQPTDESICREEVYQSWENCALGIGECESICRDVGKHLVEFCGLQQPLVLRKRTTESETESKNGVGVDVDDPTEEVVPEAIAFVETSGDPGTYLCNYLYYSSLRFSKPRENWKSVFVHIPHQKTINMDVQLSFLTCLITRLRELRW